MDKIQRVLNALSESIAETGKVGDIAAELQKENEQLKKHQKVDVKQLMTDWHSCPDDDGFEGDHPILLLAMDVDYLREHNAELKQQLEEQVVYGENLKEFIKDIDSHAMGLLSFECQKRLKQEPSPHLAAQFKADAMRELIEYVEEEYQDPRLELMFDDMKGFADQLTKEAS